MDSHNDGHTHTHRGGADFIPLITDAGGNEKTNFKMERQMEIKRVLLL